MLFRSAPCRCIAVKFSACNSEKVATHYVGTAELQGFSSPPQSTLKDVYIRYNGTDVGGWST